ncbi:helix-turn-helix transcriptional regulator [Shewanella sp. Isolate13]|uniref:helix-turn-helix transcriptional regulator n=1 Tax=Shewanella sp. Isolate13 TaxID=2908531 RepID=UPI001EFCC581|nr:helix-turn-helix transcriptional regulator [Shewanella sp. Isolate13]
MNWERFSNWQYQLIETMSRREIKGEDFSYLSDALRVDAITITVIDTCLKRQHTWSPEISENDIRFYQQHWRHDIFLNAYLRKGLLNSSQIMESLVDPARIQDDNWCESLLPYVHYHSTIGLLLGISQHLYLFFTAHQLNKEFNRGTRRLHEKLGHSIQPWVNAFHAKQLADMEQDKALCRCQKHFPITTEQQPVKLTPAEYQVLSLLMGGHSGSDIADIRRVSKETVKSQIKSVLHKTGSKHQNQLLWRYSHDQLLVTIGFNS